MGLGQPTYSLKVPSLYDGLEIDCRVYHPTTGGALGPGLKAALVGHPYAPLGGSYDDPIVHLVGGILLDQGYIVGVLNFRGAHGSLGKASWTGKPELADYISLYGFMLSYLSCLRSQKHELHSVSGRPHLSAAVQGKSQAALSETSGSIICAGYSYGSIMARYAPSSDVIAGIMMKARRTSIQEEIFLRAAHLAELQAQGLRERSRSHSRSASGTPVYPPVFIGGQESTGDNSIPGARHGLISHDIEKIRRSIDRFRNRGDKTESLQKTEDKGDTERSQYLKALPPLKTSYLLISPPIGVGVGLITAFSTLAVESKIGSFEAMSMGTGETLSERLSNNDSLAVWGESDALQPSHSLRKWAEGLSQQETSRFSSKEVPSAGHFWREQGVKVALKEAIVTWLRSNQ